MSRTRRGMISRRTVSQRSGNRACLALAGGDEPRASLSRAAEAAKGVPKRMAFLYVPNGVHMPAWTPEKVGAEFDLPSTLQSLESFKQDLLVLSGLTQDNAHAKGDGGGDHARAMACFLTGTHPRKTDGANIKAGTSVDQMAAQKIGQLHPVALAGTGHRPRRPGGQLRLGV